MDSCGALNCDRGVFASGLCRTHHRWWKAGKLFEGEPRVAKYTGPCLIDDCDRSPRARKMCTVHYSLWKRLRDVDAVAAYKPTPPPVESIDANGYTIANACHPDNKTGSGIYKHRMVMMNCLGRDLLPTETVHHKNGNRSDNRLTNLELWSTWQPPGQRVEDKVAWAKELLDLYEPEALA